MGRLIHEPSSYQQGSTTILDCRSTRVERNPFGRTQHPNFDVDWEVPSEAPSPWGAGWTQRRVRQRAEISHTPQTREAGTSAGPPVEQGQAGGGEQQDAGSDTDSESPFGGVQRQQHRGTGFRYSVRLGYDPRVFLRDPAFRGQQELTPEAKAWAEHFRLTNPAAGEQQMARRTPPRRGVYQPGQPRRAPEATNTQPSVTLSQGITASDLSDPLSRSFAALHNLLRESPFSTARPQQRHRQAEQLMSSSTTEEFAEVRHVLSQDMPSPHLSSRGVTDRLSERLQELRRHIEMSPLEISPATRESQRRRLHSMSDA